MDPNTPMKVRTLDVRVVDKNGLRDKASLKLTILDKNDNVPVFLKVSFSLAAHLLAVSPDVILCV